MSYWKRTYEHVKGKNGGDRRSEGERQTHTDTTKDVTISNSNKPQKTKKTGQRSG